MEAQAASRRGTGRLGTATCWHGARRYSTGPGGWSRRNSALLRWVRLSSRTRPWSGVRWNWSMPLHRRRTGWPRRRTGCGTARSANCAQGRSAGRRRRQLLGTAHRVRTALSAARGSAGAACGARCGGAGVERLEADNQRLDAELVELRGGYRMLREGETHCPLCGTPLGADGLAHLRQERERQGRERRAQFDENGRQLAALAPSVLTWRPPSPRLKRRWSRRSATSPPRRLRWSVRWRRALLHRRSLRR